MFNPNQHPPIRAPGRTNSITSFQSFGSVNSRTSQHQTVPPRSNSTTDLFQFDDVLAKKKPKRNSHNTATSSKLPYKQHHSMVAQVNPYSTRQQQQQQHQTVYPPPRNTTFVPNDNYSFILPAATRTQERRRSLNTTTTTPTPSQMNKQAQFAQQQNPMLARKQYQERMRSSPNYLQYRPKQERLKQKIPYTFPNGEMYIPRSKQGSYTNLPQVLLNKSQFPSPTSTAPPTLIPLNKPTSSTSTITPPSTSSSSARASSNSEDSMFLNSVIPHRVQNSDNYPGASSSPSCTDSSNDVNHESTPASSIDDFTLPTLAGPAGIKNIVGKESETEIKVSADLVATANMANILSEPVEMDPVLPERSSKRPLPASASSSPSLAAVQQFNGSPKRRALDKKVSVDSFAPSTADSAISVLSSVNHNSNSPSRTNSLVKFETERKPSFVKRLFKKMGFSGDKSTKDRPKESKLKSSPSTSSLASSLFRKSSSTVNLHQQTKPQPRSPLKSVTKVSQQSITEENADQLIDADDLSFTDTTEEINVLKLSDFDLQDELIDDFNTETILNSMFDSLNIAQMAGSVEQQQQQQPMVPEIREQPEEQSETLSKTIAALDKEDDTVMDFEDLEYIEKIIEFGDTSFPNLKLDDFGKNERKLIKRSKSIERRKPRSSSTPPKVDSVSISNGDDDDDELLPIVKFILVNELKSPSTGHNSLKSSLSTTMNNKDTAPKRSKSVSFSSNVYLLATHSATIYNRKSQRDNTNYIITPSLIQNVRMEVNEFKKEMLVHSMSQENTHFFKA
ncbi:hypothetical protein WICPIJ_008733 [Wickerhamomyces pijperi]|uniref:Uncharacterized protein n=1 Tax=Wickerhamomyces pijperi TaxID=599730 RepID=A0A9P8PX19_WICPI|nr:hypothetical protein WICPIJ_008733 [Wickerhamomyces pijperi]